MTVNKAILVGNLGADPESRETPSGMTVTNLRIATSERVKKGEQWEDHTEWHRVVCFGRTAENAAKFLTKGKQVYIEGRIRTNKWQDKDGNDKWSTEIIADNLRFIGSKGDGASGSGGGYSGGNSGGSSGGRGGTPGYGNTGPDDGIPF